MPVSEIMSSHITTLGPDDSVKLAGAHFESGGFHHLPIVDSRKRVLGIVSDRDYWKTVSPYLDTPSESKRDFMIMNRAIHTIMTREPKTVDEHTKIGEAAKILVENQFSSLLVTDEDNKLKGIVTWKDFLRFFAQYPEMDLADGELTTRLMTSEDKEAVVIEI